MSDNQKINFQYGLVTLAAVVFTWELHEFFHWFAGTALGNRMTMTLNTAYATNGTYLQSWHAFVVDAAGPVITLLEAIVVFFLLKQHKTLFLFPFVLTCFYMRTLAGVMNIVNPNDEGRLSLALGTDVFFISLLVIGFLFYLVYKIVKLRKISAKQIVITLLWIMLCSSGIIMADQFLKVKIL